MTNKIFRIFNVLLVIACIGYNSAAHAERFRDTAIRDFDRAMSSISLSPEQKEKWNTVIGSVYHLHDRLYGSSVFGKKRAPWEVLPGQWYVINHTSEDVGSLVDNFSRIQSEDYEKVIKAHLPIHDAIEEFDDSLDMETRKRFRSKFREAWASAYNAMTDVLEKKLQKELSNVDSLTSGLKLSKDQSLLVKSQFEYLEASRKKTTAEKFLGAQNLWKAMNTPEISWGENPMFCKNYFKSYSQTLATFAEVIKRIDAELSPEQKIIFHNTFVKRYQKEIDESPAWKG